MTTTTTTGGGGGDDDDEEDDDDVVDDDVMMRMMMRRMMTTTTTTTMTTTTVNGEKVGVRRGDEDIFSYSPYKAEAAGYPEPSVPTYVCASRPVRPSLK
jgi:hypothetical protein